MRRQVQNRLTSVTLGECVPRSIGDLSVRQIMMVPTSGCCERRRWYL